MVCSPRTLSVLGCLAFTVGAFAQEKAPARPDTTATAPSPTPAQVSSTTDAAASTSIGGMPANRTRQRAISSNLASTLAQGMPKYEPPKPVEPKLEEEELPDMRDIDKPKNEIIRLPKVVVEGSRPPVFKEREILTHQAFAQLMAKKYYSEAYRGLVSGTPLRYLLPSAEASAMARYYEEKRLEDMGTMAAAANTAAALGEKAESDYIKRTSAETYMSRSDFGWQNPSKK